MNHCNLNDTAIFALGCFWGVEEYFSKLAGVSATRVGYCGGVKENPNYENLGDHSESIEIKFDPKKISYSELLKHFWEQHDPANIQPIQYRSAIFTLNRNQFDLANSSKIEVQKKLKKEVQTIIKPVCTFYPAEEYHQKYIAKKKLNKAN